MDPLSPNNIDGFADEAESYLADEGAAVLKTHLRRERSKRLIQRFKRGLKSYACTVCLFDFSARYGDVGLGFIEAHHIVSVAQLKPGAKTRIQDLVPVCSNCHRMLHRHRGLRIDELRARLRPI
jgi:predicted HNH restriction endonuclease